MLCTQAAPHCQLIVTAQTPTELLDKPTLTWHLSECSAEQSAALIGNHEVITSTLCVDAIVHWDDSSVPLTILNLVLQMTAEERTLMSCLTPWPLALRILGSAFMHKAVTLEDVQALSSSNPDGTISTERCAGT